MGRFAARLLVVAILDAAIVASIPEQQDHPVTIRTVSAESPAAEPAPPAPPPDHCTDYAAMERGEGHPVNQDWFNHLDARGYAQVRAACVYGWGAAEWECLDRLWREESGWNHLVGNGSGIPQAMPARKMASAGPDWRTNPRTQVRWGEAYIAGRYGEPTNTPRRCRAGY